MEKQFYVYIMTNKIKTTLYIGVTNDLQRRVFEHKNHLNKNSFSDRYNLEFCIYYEVYSNIELAIKREKELKKWSRIKKEMLINSANPEWIEIEYPPKKLKSETFKNQLDNLLNELRENDEI
jgi:putative endonuclease